ncbi:MAG: hypothetical protein WAJ97_19455, partial [Terriglobales bacterium]
GTRRSTASKAKADLSKWERRLANLQDRSGSDTALQVFSLRYPQNDNTIQLNSCLGAIEFS